MEKLFAGLINTKGLIFMIARRVSKSSFLNFIRLSLDEVYYGIS